METIYQSHPYPSKFANNLTPNTLVRESVSATKAMYGGGEEVIRPPVRIQLSFEVEDLPKVMTGRLPWTKKISNAPYVSVSSHDHSVEYGCTNV